MRGTSRLLFPSGNRNSKWWNIDGNVDAGSRSKIKYFRYLILDVFEGGGYANWGGRLRGGSLRNRRARRGCHV